MFDSASQVISALGLCVLVIIAGGLALRRLTGGATISQAGMRVIATLALGLKEKLLLVQVGETQFLVAITPGQINCLHVFDSPALLPGTPERATQNFGQALQQALLSRTAT